MADARVELIHSQPALHERGLEHVDDLLAVGVRRPHLAAARRHCGLFVSPPCHHGASPGGR
jgi:hypothetical protein